MQAALEKFVGEPVVSAVSSRTVGYLYIEALLKVPHANCFISLFYPLF